MNFKLIDFKDDYMASLLNLYKSNKDYFDNVSPNQEINIDIILQDIKDKPESVNIANKHYNIIANDKNEVVAVLDYLEHYPDNECLYIGLFMVDGSLQKNGIGHGFIDWFISNYVSNKFCRVRLGVVDTNIKGMKFWQAQGFSKIKTVKVPKHNWTVHIMERTII